MINSMGNCLPAMLGWGLGTSEIVIIALVVLLLFGAKRLPELARGMGQSLRIFRDEFKGIKRDIDDEEATPPRKPDDAGPPKPE